MLERIAADAPGVRHLCEVPPNPRNINYAGVPMSRPGLFSSGSLAGIHVLLVDEDPASRAELAAILRYCGCLLTVAESDAEGRKILGLATPDVVVVAVPRRHRGEIPFVRVLSERGRDEAALIPLVAVVWPDDAVTAAGLTVVQLRRPLDAWDVCRALATIVTVE